MPAPAPTPSADWDSWADLYLGDSTVAFVSAPEASSNEDASLWIARHHLELSAGVFVHRRNRMRVHFRQGFRQGALDAAPDELPRPSANVPAGGVGWAVKVGPYDHPLGAEIGADLLAVRVPSFLRITSTSSGDTSTGQDSDRVPMLTLWGRMTWEPGERGKLVLTVAIQNHPENDALHGSWEPEGEVYFGPMNALLGLGAEVQITEWLSVLPRAHWPVAARPVSYGPIVGLALRAAWPRDRDRIGARDPDPSDHDDGLGTMPRF